MILKLLISLILFPIAMLVVIFTAAFLVMILGSICGTTVRFLRG
jgi:hypothetical protein